MKLFDFETLKRLIMDKVGPKEVPIATLKNRLAEYDDAAIEKALSELEDERKLTVFMAGDEWKVRER